MYIRQRTVQNIHIHPLTQFIIIKRTVPIRNDKSLSLLDRKRRIRKKPRRLILCFVNMPHLQKHQGKAFYCLTLYHHGSILPMPELFLLINILICKIHAAVKRRMPVNHQNFPVVAVIIMRGNKRRHRRKHLTPNTKRPKTLRIIVRQQCKLTRAVIHHAHVHAFFCLPCKDFKDLSPHRALIHNKVFHKNKMLRRLKLFQHLGKLILPQRKISNRRVFKYRMTAAPVHIVRQPRHPRVLLCQPLYRILGLGNLLLRLRDNLVHALL